MKHGAHIGPYIGPAIGPRVSAAPDPLAGVTRDAASTIYRPQTAAEWNTVLTAAGAAALTPIFGLNCQVASGDLLNTFGSSGFNGIVGGTLAYQQAVPGWTATCVKTTDGSTGWSRSVNAGIPDIASSSLLVLALNLFPASSAGDRTIMQMGAAFGTRVGMDSDGSNHIVGISSPNSIAGTSTGNWGSVRFTYTLINRTAGISRVGTNLEILSPAIAVDPAGQEIVWGGDFSDTWNAGGSGLIDLWAFSGDCTQAMLKSIIQTCGQSVAW